MRIDCVTRVGGVTAALLVLGSAPGEGVAVAQSSEQSSAGELFSPWRLNGVVADAHIDETGGPDGGPCRVIRLAESGKAVLAREITVLPARVYSFRARIRSSDSAVVTIGLRRMAHSVPGQWQTVTDLVRTGSGDSLGITIALNRRPGGDGVFRIADVRIAEAGLPSVPPRKRLSGTRLVEQGAAAATIVYPSSMAGGQELGLRVRDAVRGRAAADLPVLSDTEATAADRPALIEALRDRRLVLIGRLGINRAMWVSYNRFLSAADGYYPGGDGYVVRTARNVLRNGMDHIILGGSSDRGVARAVDAFIAVLEATPATEGTLALPWLLRVELGGACRDAFDQDDELWATDPHNVNLPAIEPGYQTVVRWYMNAMAYYWSGLPGYRRRTLEYLEPVIADKAYTHHYIVEFLIRAYDMLDDSGLFSDAQVRAVDGLILENFREFLIGPDLRWMTCFDRPYEGIHLVNRHSIAPWMADITMADFLHDYFVLDGELGEMVAYRRAEKHAFLRHLVAERWRTSLPRGADASHDEEVIASLFRYALHHELYGFFESGNARRALVIEDMRPVRGVIQDDHLVLGILGHYYRDGRYRALLDTVPAPRQLFQHRYVCGTRRYRPGPELVAGDPDGLAGVLVPPLMPHDKRILPSCRFSLHRAPTVAPEQAFESVTFRESFGPHGDFFRVSGFGKDAGAVTDFQARGRVLLSATPPHPPAGNPAGYVGRNAAFVLRTDRWIDDEKPYAGAARLNRVESGRTSGAVSFTIDPFMTASWRRDVVWLRPGLYVVRDTLTALEDGDYMVRVGWRPHGALARDGDALLVSSAGVRARVTPLAPGFALSFGEHLGADPGQIERLVMAWDGHLKQGAGVTALTVLQAEEVSAELAAPALRWDGDGCPLIDLGLAPGDRANVALLSGLMQPAPGPAPGLRDDAGPTARKALAAIDMCSNWRRAWTCTGLQRPAPVPTARRLAGGVLDFGRTVRLGEIRAVRRGRFWSLSRIPEDLETALPTDQGVPGPDSTHWRKLDAPVEWRAGVETGNYGRAVPVPQAYQVAFPEGLRARYVRGSRAAELVYYDADRLAARTPLRLDVATVQGSVEPRIFVLPRIWPPFLRRRQEEDSVMAVLLADGSEVFQYQSPSSMQAVRLLELDEGEGKQIVTVTDDAQIRIFTPDGDERMHLDLYAMHREFHRVEGRANTRHPAGGLTMPYSVGAWRPDARGRRKLVVSRYGSLSFIDAEGKFEGVHMCGSYVTPALLAHGIDFDGDGQDEQLCLDMGRLHHIAGDARPTVRDPGGALFYPQVYASTSIHEFGSAGPTVDGTEVVLVQPVPFAQEPRRYVLVVRASSLGWYDGAEREWAFKWPPLVAIRSAAVTRADPECVEVVVATGANLLWRLVWRGGADELSAFEVRTVPHVVNRLAACPGRPDTVFIAAADGLYRLDGFERLVRLAPEAWQDVRAWPASEDGRASIVAITADGEVARLEPRPDGPERRPGSEDP